MIKKEISEPNLFKYRLSNLLDLAHPLCRLASSIDLEDLHESFKTLYSEDMGRPAKSVRLMVGLHYLKYM
ncbi:MAG TPA: IS5/IS1182 family transposase, partial [Candidatus Cloacimonetes bacterium]|nr:IS5/IS1182 family transposase [Candidatus Cloacimonadota bacterium]HEX37470.1 IS5/IS1182 family transposase [Candidatus Cloacimonadota bacterium]